MGVRVFNCCAVLLAVFYVCFGATDAAAINGGPRSASARALTPANENVHALRVARQAYSDEDESEEEDDIQAQNFAQQQQQQIPDDSQEDSDEDDADDDGDDDGTRRRRRDTQAAEGGQSESPMHGESAAVPEPLPAPATNGVTDAIEKEPEHSAEANAPTVAAAPNAPSRNTSVLILIRDALKKVTTLPTEQVATNALQYFQLFEHFIQQTIENVIGDDDDDEDEAAGVAATTIKPDGIFTPEEEEIIAGVEEILKEPELVNKQPTQEPKPAETPAAVENVVGETKPAPLPDMVTEEKPATAAVTAASAA
ncbi:probable serine/threonine-protein kinase kinX [Bactrocera tryoni]|uniref:probable serine/threonine-protein kinase kinX n=1 Tax=Bactrocera tryoni TaxID=59916 RepID=UPI001A9853A2|nr:probable serine/threonine-protein kinase kinX [Bactrocera tryoni]